MAELMKTALPASRKAELAASALGRQGQHGAMTALARDFDVARGTVYAAKQTAKDVLAAHFAAVAPTVGGNGDDLQMHELICPRRTRAPD